jgi:hypothetical protein
VALVLRGLEEDGELEDLRTKWERAMEKLCKYKEGVSPTDMRANFIDRVGRYNMGRLVRISVSVRAARVIMEDKYHLCHILKAGSLRQWTTRQRQPANGARGFPKRAATSGRGSSSL